MPFIGPAATERTPEPGGVSRGKRKVRHLVTELLRFRGAAAEYQFFHCLTDRHLGTQSEDPRDVSSRGQVVSQVIGNRIPAVGHKRKTILLAPYQDFRVRGSDWWCRGVAGTPDDNVRVARVKSLPQGIIHVLVEEILDRAHGLELSEA
jgi:hypothetical protein